MLHNTRTHKPVPSRDRTRSRLGTGKGPFRVIVCLVTLWSFLFTAIPCDIARAAGSSNLAIDSWLDAMGEKDAKVREKLVIELVKALKSNRDLRLVARDTEGEIVSAIELVLTGDKFEVIELTDAQLREEAGEKVIHAEIEVNPASPPPRSLNTSTKVALAIKEAISEMNEMLDRNGEGKIWVVRALPCSFQRGMLMPGSDIDELTVYYLYDNLEAGLSQHDMRALLTDTLCTALRSVDVEVRGPGNSPFFVHRASTVHLSAEKDQLGMLRMLYDNTSAQPDFKLLSGSGTFEIQPDCGIRWVGDSGLDKFEARMRLFILSGEITDENVRQLIDAPNLRPVQRATRDKLLAVLDNKESLMLTEDELRYVRMMDDLIASAILNDSPAMAIKLTGSREAGIMLESLKRKGLVAVKNDAIAALWRTKKNWIPVESPTHAPPAAPATLPTPNPAEQAV